MKQELTIAVVLLAIGGLFWASGKTAKQEPLQTIFGSHNAHAVSGQEIQAVTSSASQQRSFNSDQLYIDQDFSPHYSAAPSVVPASYQQLIDAKTEEVFAPNAAAIPSNEFNTSRSPHSKSPALSATAGYFHRTSNTQAAELLASAATQIANSVPFQSKLSLRGSVLGQELAASGNYFQMGQGSRKAKIELSFDQMPGQPEMLQLCDGRFVYTIHSAPTNGEAETKETAPRQKLEFVDLLRVQEATGDISAASQRVVSPTGGLATGGVSSLLRNLASNFNFGTPEALDPNSDQILIRGSWDENSLRRIILDFDDQIKLGSPIQWAKLPRHIPHAIELVLTRSLNQTYFPSQVSYLRFGVNEHGATVEPTISMSFSTPQPLSSLAEGFFVLDSSKFDPTDRTDRYIAQIKFFRSAQELIAIQEDPVQNSFIK